MRNLVVFWKILKSEEIRAVPEGFWRKSNKKWVFSSKMKVCEHEARQIRSIYKCKYYCENLPECGEWCVEKNMYAYKHTQTNNAPECVELLLFGKELRRKWAIFWEKIERGLLIVWKLALGASSITALRADLVLDSISVQRWAPEAWKIQWIINWNRVVRDGRWRRKVFLIELVIPAMTRGIESLLLFEQA